MVSHVERSLSFISLIQSYILEGKINKAVSLLLSWDWGEQCYIALQKIFNELMKLPLTEENAQMLQNALGSFHSPSVPLSVEIKHRYGAQVILILS